MIARYQGGRLIDLEPGRLAPVTLFLHRIPRMRSSVFTSIPVHASRDSPPAPPPHGRETSRLWCQGEWVDDIRHGRGTLRFKDGSYYRGDFENERFTGDDHDNMTLPPFHMHPMSR
jgi:hypothetical protein